MVPFNHLAMCKLHYSLQYSMWCLWCRLEVGKNYNNEKERSQTRFITLIENDVKMYCDGYIAHIDTRLFLVST